VPVVAPSANLSGRPSPTTWQAVLEDLEGRIDCVLRGGPTEIGLESTVVDCTGEIPVLLRQGAVSLKELRAVVRETRVPGQADAIQNLSPGLRHRHYTPAAKVQIVGAPVPEEDRNGTAWIGLGQHDPSGFELSRTCASVDEYAAKLFEFFRECDRQGILTVYCEQVAETGIGAALMDRLRRAASEISSG
jgi:L-threonylcarbamoyladenylate synthase